MGDPNELADGVGGINLAGFWKPWNEVEKKAPGENKDAYFVRVSAGFVGLASEPTEHHSLGTNIALALWLSGLRT
eukprot:g41522.t1